ncbi:transporter [Sphingobacterium sp. SGL-16]|uniref:transporter n=1 Tax=Sphingobacterium sp. SGL-16 TaxID=2710883 RepID=UPI0013EE236E|nr:transporter [Sphingobacterium sp. SGL-16]NGM71731.1 transporter [Sphingobacterium sp. SGL-16]
MRKIILLTAIAGMNFTSLFACEICGGGLGSNYTGLLPNFNKRFVGIRYHFNYVNTQLDVDGKTTALSNKEKYHTAELWSAWNIGSRWRVMAIVPYSHIEKFNYGTDSKSKKDGLGDINLSGYFNLLNKESVFTQSIWVGVGAKLPTGQYNKDEFTNMNSPNIYQLGTGSVDFTGSVNYDIRLNNIGLNTNASYKVNTKNKDDYQYGNKLTLNGSVYYNTALSSDIKLRPNVGLQYENQAKDHTMDYQIDETGGYNTNTNLGLEATVRGLAFGFSYQTPIAQNISKGRTELVNKFLTHLTFTF